MIIGADGNPSNPPIWVCGICAKSCPFLSAWANRAHFEARTLPWESAAPIRQWEDIS